MNRLEWCIVGAIVLILGAVIHDSVRVSGLKKACLKDRPEYECEAMFRSHAVYMRH